MAADKKSKVGYNPAEIESHWQKVWEESELFSPDLEQTKKPYYNLMMFPYPSAEGLHVGNMYAFTGADVWGRFTRMRGFDVFEPIGLDGFGIHSENYAIKIDQHPATLSKRTQERFYKQLHATGNAYSWRHTLETYDPDYYRWTQWIFIQMFKHGLAYRSKSEVNWCPSCKTVLADEQVITGECERCRSKVERRELEQWFFKITDYADRLLANLNKIDWVERVKIAQRNWIGKKEGIEIEYSIENTEYSIKVFTTRPDTNFGATFIVLSPEHPLASKLATPEQKQNIKKYIEVSRGKTTEERVTEGHKKTGAFTGRYVINGLNGEKMPIWVSDFVLMGFGTGAVVGVPGHDKRDFEFAKEFGLPIKRVVVREDGDTSRISRIEQVQEEEGRMINSGFLDGLKVSEAIGKMMDYLEKKGWGKRVTTYHLRDWLISRQRYWGPPIPMIYCESCAKGDKGEREDMPGWYAVAEEQLPVELPYIEDYQPKGTGVSPLAQDKEWVNVACPQCRAPARRETDVSDTFLDSAWYFLRYPSVGIKDRKLPWDPEVTKRWLPVHMYIGGAEHSVLHLMYARFITMAFYDWGLIDFEEPFSRFYAHGLLIKDGAKMSKSKGNVVVPDQYIKKYGADTLRTYLMFLGPFDQGGDFRDTGMEGMHKFLKRVWRLVQENSKFEIRNSKRAEEIYRVMHKTIKRVTEDVERLRYNRAIAGLMEYVNSLSVIAKPTTEKLLAENRQQKTDNLIRCAEWEEAIRTLLLLLAPFAPHMSEELFQSSFANSKQNGEFQSIHLQPWPTWSPELVEEKLIEIPVQVDGKLRATVLVAPSEVKEQDKVEVLAREDERVREYLTGREIKKIIFIPGKLVNFVLD